MEGQPFYIEEKVDGERMQLHKGNNTYKYFSRRSVIGQNTGASFHAILKDCQQKNIQNYSNRIRIFIYNRQVWGDRQTDKQSNRNSCTQLTNQNDEILYRYFDCSNTENCSNEYIGHKWQKKCFSKNIRENIQRYPFAIGSVQSAGKCGVHQYAIASASTEKAGDR